MHDSTLAQLEGKRACKRRRNELKKNRPHPHSIAMENPHYVPKILDPANDGAKVSAADVSIPQFDWSPIYVQSREEQQPDLEAPEMLAGRLNYRHHVTHRERHSLLTRRNREFASNMPRKVCRTVHEDQGIYEDNEEEVSLSQPPTQSAAAMNGSYTYYIFMLLHLYCNLKPVLTGNRVICFINNLDQSQPKHTGDPTCTTVTDDGNFLFSLY